MKALLNRVIDYLQATFPPNRIVVLLSPVFVALSASASAWLATNFPGVTFGPDTISGFAAAGALAAITAVYRWLDGWQKHEGRQADLYRLAAVPRPKRRHQRSTVVQGQETRVAPPTSGGAFPLE